MVVAAAGAVLVPGDLLVSAEFSLRTQTTTTPDQSGGLTGMDIRMVMSSGGGTGSRSQDKREDDGEKRGDVCV
jgi:hypothetical protein